MLNFKPQKNKFYISKFYQWLCLERWQTRGFKWYDLHLFISQAAFCMFTLSSAYSSKAGETKPMTDQK